MIVQRKLTSGNVFMMSGGIAFCNRPDDHPIELKPMQLSLQVQNVIGQSAARVSDMAMRDFRCTQSLTQQLTCSDRLNSLLW